MHVHLCVFDCCTYKEWKSCQKTMWKADLQRWWILDRVWIDFGTILGTKIDQNRSEKHSKNVIKFKMQQKRNSSGFLPPFGVQRRPNTSYKWSQMKPKSGPNRFQNRHSFFDWFGMRFRMIFGAKMCPSWKKKRTACGPHMINGEKAKTLKNYLFFNDFGGSGVWLLYIKVMEKLTKNDVEGRLATKMVFG